MQFSSLASREQQPSLSTRGGMLPGRLYTKDCMSRACIARVSLLKCAAQRSSAVKPLTGRLVAAGDVFSGEEEAAWQPR